MKKSLLLASAALAVCAAPAHAGWSSGTFGGLSALIYTPDSKPASGRMLFVNLHGCAQKNTDLQKSNWDGVAEKYNAVVVLPNAKNTTLIQCWNYGNPSINQADADAVVSGTRTIIADTRYGIDPAQVYMTGISSGAAFAATVGCANPDLYAGVGSAAGPTIKSNQQNAMSGESVNVASVVTYCKNLATGKTDGYKTQLWAQTYGAELPSGDNVCAAGYIEPNHKISQQLLGLTGGNTHEQDIPASNPTAGHTTVNENEHYIQDANGAKRIALIEIGGMGHNWPGGVPKSGSVGSYVSNKFDFGEWMAVNFTANNCRMEANKGKAICGVPPIPPVGNPTCGVKALNSVTLSWTAPNATIDGYKITQGATAKTTTATTITFDGLNQGSTYSFTIAATKGSTVGTPTTISCDTDGVAPKLPAPTGLTGTPTASTVQLSWNAVEGAKSYNVYRNDALVKSATTNSALDSGLAEKTAYQYKVATVNKDNVEGDKSGLITVTTLAAQCWSQVVTDTTSNHYVAKRLTLNQYLAAGNKMGYINKWPLYGFGSPIQWSNKSDCSAMAF